MIVVSIICIYVIFIHNITHTHTYNYMCKLSILNQSILPKIMSRCYLLRTCSDIITQTHFSLTGIILTQCKLNI